MKTVWLENTIAFEPERWLPGEYKSWEALLTAAVEAAVKDPQAPQELAKWKYGDSLRVQIAHPIFGKVPWLKRFASTQKLPQSGNGITVKQVGAARARRRDLGGPSGSGPLYIEHCEWRVREFVQSVLQRSICGVVRGKHVWAGV